MKRDNHYEVAFEAYLRSHGVGFIAVDEANRSMLGDADVKSLDFIIVGPNDAKLVVDVKGRKFPGGSAERPIMTWQNWTTLEDIDGLERWAKVLGPDYRGVLAFAYEIQPPFVLPNDTRDLFAFRGQTFLMRAVEVSAYREHMRRRSPKWGTVGLPVAAFRKIIRPFIEFLAPAPVLQS
ncbi:HYExAFE family protein [Limnoglobus roseus]|uniref:Uncharacterized protein n=1 Tax=Limnoglobus roseus TaxID=2598579 RepID=A0A5C1AJA4_9BACT|nr:HYExAFE family protein [Limnoglobus roseus]QEL18950.1 hypothetical protein PX52LOC_06000 [Limnoglobus roseus]